MDNIPDWALWAGVAACAFYVLSYYGILSRIFPPAQTDLSARSYAEFLGQAAQGVVSTPQANPQAFQDAVEAYQDLYRLVDDEGKQVLRDSVWPSIGRSIK